MKFRKDQTIYCIKQPINSFGVVKGESYRVVDNSFSINGIEYVKFNLNNSQVICKAEYFSTTKNKILRFLKGE